MDENIITEMSNFTEIEVLKERLAGVQNLLKLTLAVSSINFLAIVVAIAGIIAKV